MFFFKSFLKPNKGGVLIFVIVFMAVFLTVATGLLEWVRIEIRATKQQEQKRMTFQIAEAGIDYYRWHLAHDPEDYQDGQGVPGPYPHDFKDRNGNVIGRFVLEITPPPTGSTVVTIKSEGYLLANPRLKRKIVAKVGRQSLTDYSFLTNTDVWFGETENVLGKLHANGGIRFDGKCNDIVSSAKETYICQPYHGCWWEEKPGIWGEGGPQHFWEFPLLARDFEAITTDLAEIKEEAQKAGVYFSSSGSYGYHLKFKEDGSFDAYRVTNLKEPCYAWDVNGNFHSESNSIKRETFLENYPIPANGLVFVEDKVWVDGRVRGRVTIGSGRFPTTPETMTTIVIPDNLTYVNKDGSDVIGLIAQKDIIVPCYAPDVLEIHAGLIAQNGSVQRFYYPGNIKKQITTYGSIISNGIWTWSWVWWDGTVVSGYKKTITTYDPNLTFGPPPKFPTYGEFETISWEEK